MKHTHFFGKKTLAAVSAAALVLTATPAGVLAANPSETASSTLGEVASSVGQAYGLYLDSLKNSSAGARASYTITPGDGLYSMLSSMIGDVDLSWLKDVTVTQEQSIENGNMALKFVVSLNGTTICTVNGLMDTASNVMYMNIPELNDGYLKIDLNAVSEEEFSASTDTSIDYQQMMEILNNADQYFPSADEVENLINTYGEIAISHISDEGSEEGSMTAAGITQNVTISEGRITEENLLTTFQELIAAAKDDAQLKEILDNISSISPELDGLYDAFIEGLNEMDEDLAGESEFSEENYISAKVFTDAEDNVVGHSFSIHSEGSDDMPEMRILTPTDGTTEGFEFSVDADGDELHLIGSGTNTDAGLTGEYTLTINGEDLLSFQLTDVTEDLDAKTASGNLTLSYIGSDEEIPADSSLAIGFNTVDQSGDYTIGVTVSGMSLAEIAMHAEPAEGIPVPSVESLGTIYDITNDADLQTYTSTMNISGLITSLTNAGAGDFINSLLGGMTE